MPFFEIGVKTDFFQLCGHCWVFQIKKQRYHFTDKGLYNQRYGFSSSQMWELGHKEGWAMKNWILNCGSGEEFEMPLESKEIKPDNPRWNQPWIFTGRTDAEAEAPVPDAKSCFLGKDPDAGKHWGQKKKGTTEDEMVGWHHWSNAHEFEQVVGVGDRQGSLVCHSPWDRKESDTTEWLNWTELNPWKGPCFSSPLYPFVFLVGFFFFSPTEKSIPICFCVCFFGFGAFYYYFLKFLPGKSKSPKFTQFF